MNKESNRNALPVIKVGLLYKGCGAEEKFDSSSISSFSSIASIASISRMVFVPRAAKYGPHQSTGHGTLAFVVTLLILF
jgi:hypothetical protein